MVHQSGQGNKFKSISKKLSQIIARSWLKEKTADGQEQYANPELRKKLLFADRIALKDYLNQELEKLDSSLGNSALDEFGIVAVERNWNSFNGELAESLDGLVYKFPYPPEPSSLSQQTLKDWINNTDDKIVTPDQAEIAYLPLTVC